jgi:hypothetical protein
MGLSKGEAEAKAVRIAKEFVAANGGDGWTCGGAKPDYLSPDYKRRKNIIKWCVLFERSIGGVIFDGPAIVLVDIETGRATYF